MFVVIDKDGRLDDNHDVHDDDDGGNDDELEMVELLGRVTSYLIPAYLTNAILL